MDCSKIARQLVGLIALVEVLFQFAYVFRQVKAACERMHLRNASGSNSRDRTRVHATAQIGAKRHVAYELPGHGRLEPFA